jgi:hypothetical protein
MTIPPFAESVLIFGLIFAGAGFGMFLRRILPQDHLGTAAKDAVQLAIGLVVTMTGLVLGMLVSSAKTYYDGQRNQIAAMAADIIILNDMMIAYGPETKQMRIVARNYVQSASDRIWPTETSLSVQLKPEERDIDVNAQLELLRATNARQTDAKTQMTSLLLVLKKSYWLLYLQSEQTSMSVPLLMVVTLWLITIFISFGVFAPSNSTVIVTLIACALAVSVAILIILEMYSPFSGLLTISPVAVRDALRQMAVKQ